MMSYVFVFVAFAALLSQGYGLQEFRLEDRTVTHISNPLIAFNMGIPKLFSDTLEACSVTFPNGITYEAYPHNNLPNTVIFAEAVDPYKSCAVSMRNVGEEMSGTYELTSLVRHTATNEQSITKQLVHLKIVKSELWD